MSGYLIELLARLALATLWLVGHQAGRLGARALGARPVANRMRPACALAKLYTGIGAHTMQLSRIGYWFRLECVTGARGLSGDQLSLGALCRMRADPPGAGPVSLARAPPVVSGGGAPLCSRAQYRWRPNKLRRPCAIAPTSGNYLSASTARTGRSQASA